MVFSVTEGMFSTNPGIVRAFLRVNADVFHHDYLHNDDNFDTAQGKFNEYYPPSLWILGCFQLFSTNAGDAYPISTSSQRPGRG